VAELEKLNTYSLMPVAQLQEYEYRIPTGFTLVYNMNTDICKARVQILALTLLHIHTLPGGLCHCSAHALTRGWSYPTPLAHSHTQTHTLSYGIAMGVYSLSLSLSLSDALLGSWQL